MNVLRRYLVENACTRIDKDMCVRLVCAPDEGPTSSALSHEQVGALHGRISRSVEGFVRFLRISFLDFIPALLSGSFALAAALVEAAEGRAGDGRRRPALARPDDLAADDAEGRPARPAPDPRGDGRHGRRAALRARLRPRRQHARAGGPAGSSRRPSGGGRTRSGTTSRCRSSAAARRSTRASSTCWSSPFAIYLFVHGGIAYGDILAFSVLFLSVMAPLNEVHRFIDEAHESSLRVGDLLEMLDAAGRPLVPPGRSAASRGWSWASPCSSPRTSASTTGPPTARPSRALDGVSLAIRHGETIGVAGRSGCGKSTWLRVLMRLTHPCGGRAMLGGVPLESISREAIGDLIGYVGQNPFVFAGTIAENIAYGSPRRDRRARSAAPPSWPASTTRSSRCPAATRRGVAERGQNLSGGQRQRIALARVFLKNPPILILDEGTSALDNISERKVQQAINAARADRTVILVAHRLSTCSTTDRIFVFDEGRVVETGTYDELVHRGGAFAELVRSASEGIPDELVEAA